MRATLISNPTAGKMASRDHLTEALLILEGEGWQVDVQHSRSPGDATRIARDWNTRDAASGYAGYVTRFRVRREYLDRYERKVAGGIACQEYWIPAADLDEFNRNIIGEIEVIAEFHREGAPEG